MDSVQILWVNRSFTPCSSGVKPHDHPYYHMFVIISGSLDLTVRDTLLHLKKGDCVVVPRDSRHSYINSGDQLVEALEVKFTIKSKSLAAELDRLGLPFSDNALICPLIDTLTHEYESLGSAANEAAKSYLLASLRLITAEDRRLRKDALSFLEFPEASELTHKIIGWLEDHYHDPFSLEKMAEDLSFNKTYLCAAFKKDTDMTILDCLNLIRIRKAAGLISYSEHSIAHVAEMCGFGSASTFNHVFQKYVGTTPLQVRKAFPNGILFDQTSEGYGKLNDPNRYLFNALAGKRIF